MASTDTEAEASDSATINTTVNEEETAVVVNEQDEVAASIEIGEDEDEDNVASASDEGIPAPDGAGDDADDGINESDAKGGLEEQEEEEDNVDDGDGEESVENENEGEENAPVSPHSVESEGVNDSADGPAELPDDYGLEEAEGEEENTDDSGGVDVDTEGYDHDQAHEEEEEESERFVSFVPGDVAGPTNTNSEEEEEEPAETLTLEKLEELTRLAADEQESLQSRNLLLQRKLSQYLSTKKSEEPSSGSEKSMIDMDKLYRKSMQRVKERRRKLAELQASLDRKMLDLKEKLDEREALVSQGTSDLVEFKRQIALSAEHTRTGRPIPRDVIHHHENQEQTKDRAIQLVRLRYITLQQKLTKLEASLRSKEELGEGLHLIDFQQLKIENHSLAEKIEERNEEVLKLRKKITHAVQMLTHLKEKQQFVQNENLELIQQLKNLDLEVAEEQTLLSSIKRERDTLRTENTKLRQESGLMGKVDLLEDFEARKYELKKQQDRLNELQRRHMDLLGKINALFAPISSTSGHAQGRGQAQAQGSSTLTSVGVGDDHGVSGGVGGQHLQASLNSIE